MQDIAIHYVVHKSLNVSIPSEHSPTAEEINRQVEQKLREVEGDNAELDAIWQRQSNEKEEEMLRIDGEVHMKPLSVATEEPERIEFINASPSGDSVEPVKELLEKQAKEKGDVGLGYQPMSLLHHAPEYEETAKVQVTGVPVFFCTNRLKEGNSFSKSREPVLQPSFVPGLLHDGCCWVNSKKIYIDHGADLKASGDIILFIHGYNNTFTEALQRAAQLKRALSTKDTTMTIFSWPAKTTRLFTGGTLSVLDLPKHAQHYAPDEASSSAAVHLARNYILTLVAKLEDGQGKGKVHIIGHSMGCRVALNAVALLEKGKVTGRLGQFVLAAPDEDLDAFVLSSKEVRDHVDRITVYFSHNDNVLWLSEKLHSQERLGRVGPSVFSTWPLDQKFNFISCHKVASKTHCHDYFAEEKQVLNDLIMVLEGQLPNARRLKPVDGAPNAYIL